MPEDDTEQAAMRRQLGQRLVLLRTELDGPAGARTFATRLGLSLDDWLAYEEGATAPAETLLRVVEVTGAEPQWILDGTTPRYRPGSQPTQRGPASTK